MNYFVPFIKDVVCRKSYYIPVFFFSMVSYSFSIFNRTVSIDDILRHNTIDVGLRGRWGGFLFFNVLGITEFDPFIDRFLAVSFFVVTAILLSYLFYRISGINSVWIYTLTSSTFITYPLVNEIWEYTTANGASGCYLAMVTLAVIVLRSNLSNIRKYVISTFLLLIPMSGYEISIFYYVSLISIILFYEYNKNDNIPLLFKKWIKQNLYFFMPVFIAFIFRFVISFILFVIYDFEYNSGGDTHIVWLNYDFLPTLKGMVVANFIHYIVFGLVYFPITIFAIALFCFIIYLFCCRSLFRSSALGTIVIISLFLQAIIQGDLLPYRHTMTLSLFVAFVVFLLCTTISKSKIIRIPVYILLFCICWYQAVFLNRILSLNNLRSDNELAVIRQMGVNIESKFDKKPLVIVSGYKTSNWINSQITADDTTWNGSLFYSICNILGDKLEIPYKFVDTNVNTATSEFIQLREIFNYCGFDIEVIPSQFYLTDKKKRKKEWDIMLEASEIAKEKKIKPYQIFDNGQYLIVSLGGEFFVDKDKK